MTSRAPAAGHRGSEYFIGNSLFRVLYGDLTDVVADALVSSDDNLLTMGGGVSLALLRAGGSILADDAAKHIPLALGDVVVTTAGKLRAKYIFHGVTIDHDTMSGPNSECIREIISRCLELAEALRLRHVAFPALGTGVGGYPFELAADVMTRAIATFLADPPRHVAEVTLTLHAREGVRPSELDIFYERAVGLAAQWTDSRHLNELVAMVEKIVARSGSESLLQRLHALRSEITNAEAELAQRATTQTLDALHRHSPLGSASSQADELAAKSAEVLDWEDITARETVLQLRLQSLRTQHNILIGNRNQLEERKAKYGPTAVPIDVENALADVIAEISSRETDIRTVKTELAQLGASRSKVSGR